MITRTKMHFNIILSSTSVSAPSYLFVPE